MSAPPQLERHTLNSASTSKRSRRPLLVPILIGIVAIALIIFSLTGGDDDEQPAATPTPQETANDEGPGDEDFEPTPQEPSQEEIDAMVAELATFAHRDADDPLAIGDVDAPVVMIVYSDFRCPYCGEWSRTTLPALTDKYVDSGEMRVEWRDMPVLGDPSVEAALAARAAANQGQFWEFADALYDEEWQSAATDDSYAAESMADKADEMGMDRAQFLTDIEDAEAAADVNANRDQAWSIGFTGTPAFLVEGLPVMGAQPLEVFESAIDQRLEELQQEK